MLCDGVWHGGLCGGVGNVRVHGGIFDSVSIENTSSSTYTDRTSLKINRGHNATRNKKNTSVDYQNAIDFLGKKLLN